MPYFPKDPTHSHFVGHYLTRSDMPNSESSSIFDGSNLPGKLEAANKTKPFVPPTTRRHSPMGSWLRISGDEHAAPFAESDLGGSAGP